MEPEEEGTDFEIQKMNITDNDSEIMSKHKNPHYKNQNSSRFNMKTSLSLKGIQFSVSFESATKYCLKLHRKLKNAKSFCNNSILDYIFKNK